MICLKESLCRVCLLYFGVGMSLGELLTVDFQLLLTVDFQLLSTEWIGCWCTITDGHPLSELFHTY